MGTFETLLWGLAGGVFSELLRLYRDRENLEWAPYLRRPQYLIPTVLMILAGALLTLAYARSDFVLKPLLAVNIGASAPLLIGTLVATAPSIDAGRIN